MKYLSLFSGIGGFELGIQQSYEESLDNRRVAGTSELAVHGDKSDTDTGDGDGRWSNPVCIGYSEIDKYAIQIYQKHFPDHYNYGDITKINETELPNFDLLCGGFPCQSFSIAGKRGGFADTRGTLFFDIARIIKHKQPRLLLLENVKGLLSHDSGKTFRVIISTLDELGYDVQWQVLNSKNFGVPQNRERVFIIGHLRGSRRPQVFPFGETDRAIDEGFEQENSKSEIASTVRSRYGNGTGSHIQPVLTPDRSKKRQNGRRFKENGEPSFTITAQDRHGIYDGMKIRRLTPTECERLQGFPDRWTEGISDTQRYKCLGNAVTVNVIREIVKHLI